MKRRLWKACILIFAFSFMMMGCKKNVGTPEDNAIPKEKEEEPVAHIYGFSAITMDNPFYKALEGTVRNEVEMLGSTLITEDPKGDANTQAQQIQNMIDRGVEAIFLSPVDWEKITPSLNSLKEADVKIINIDTQVKEIEAVDTYIGSDNLKAGELCGEYMIEDFSEGGAIGILECQAVNSIKERIKSFEETIAKADCGFEIVGRSETDGDREKAKEECQKILQAHPELKALMCGNDQIALGAEQAAKEIGRNDIRIYSVDASPQLKQAMMEEGSLIAGTVAQSPISIGKKAVEIGQGLLNGERPEEKEIFEDVNYINEENINLFGEDGWQ